MYDTHDLECDKDFFRVDWIDGQGIPHEEFFYPGDNEPRWRVCDRARIFADYLRPHMRGSVRVFDLGLHPLHKAAIV